MLCRSSNSPRCLRVCWRRSESCLALESFAVEVFSSVWSFVEVMVASGVEPPKRALSFDRENVGNIPRDGYFPNGERCGQLLVRWRSEKLSGNERKRKRTSPAR